MKREEQIEEEERILDSVFHDVELVHPVECRFCNQIIERSARLAHLRNFRIEHDVKFNGFGKQEFSERP